MGVQLFGLFVGVCFGKLLADNAANHLEAFLLGLCACGFVIYGMLVFR